MKDRSISERSYDRATFRSQYTTTQKENTLPGLGVVFAGGVVVVNACVVLAAEIQIISNDGEGKPCCRIGNKQTRTM